MLIFNESGTAVGAVKDLSKAMPVKRELVFGDGSLAAGVEPESVWVVEERVSFEDAGGICAVAHTFLTAIGVVLRIWPDGQIGTVTSDRELIVYPEHGDYRRLVVSRHELEGAAPLAPIPAKPPPERLGPPSARALLNIIAKEREERGLHGVADAIGEDAADALSELVDQFSDY